MPTEMDEPRSQQQRKADALAKLTAPELDCWVASGAGHLVPLSCAWDGEHIVVAIQPEALTTRNILAAGRARVALGGTRDVVMVDVELADSLPVAELATNPEIGERFAAQADWDPRKSPNTFVYLRLRPTRVQVWREENEHPDRTIMRDGAWLA